MKYLPKLSALPYNDFVHLKYFFITLIKFINTKNKIFKYTWSNEYEHKKTRSFYYGG